MSDLLECPFCGHMAEYIANKTHKGVYCSYCDAKVECELDNPVKPEKNWNTRIVAPNPESR